MYDARSTQNQYKDLLESGMKHQSEGRYKEAVRDFKGFVNVSDNDRFGIFELGLTCSAMDDFNEALFYWQKMTDEDGDIYLDHLDCIHAQHTEQFLDKWEKYAAGLDFEPANLFTVGFAYMIMGQFSLAVEFFDKLVSIDPLFKSACFYRGICNYNNENMEEAEKDFLKELESSPDYYQCLYYLGLTFLKQKKMRRAVDSFEKAVEKFPQYVKAHYELGKAYSLMGKFPKAVEALENLLEYNPRFIPAYFELGRVYERQFLMDRAIIQYQLALNLSPDFTAANLELGLLYRKLNKDEQALEHLNRVIRLEPDETKAHFAIGEICLGRNNPADAVEHFRTVIEKDPLHGDALFFSGKALSCMGESDEAVKVFEKARELNPENTKIINALGLEHMKSGRADLAIECFNTVLVINSDDPHACHNLGTLFFSNGNFEKAVEFYMKAARMMPSKTYPHFTNGVLHIRNNDFEEGEKEFRKASTQGPVCESDYSVHATLSLLATTAIEQSRSNDYHKEMHNYFYKKTESLARALADLADGLSPEHEGHSARVARTSKLMAKQMNMSHKEVLDVYLGGLLHDVGKLKLPLKLFRFPSDILPDEDNRKLMEHTSLGSGLLRSLEGLENIADLVHSHHECYDGSGYPDGLRSDSIPAGSGIIALADFYDKLAFREKLETDQIVERIIDLRFKAFSSEAVSALLNVVDELAVN